MKIAITASGNTLASVIDSRFGRCTYFAIYDSESNATEFLLNPSKEAQEGAGPAAVQFVAAQKVSKIVSSEFGMKIKSLLDSLKIEMITHDNSTSTIAELIEQYK